MVVSPARRVALSVSPLVALVVPLVSPAAKYDGPPSRAPATHGSAEIPVDVARHVGDLSCCQENPWQACRQGNAMEKDMIALWEARADKGLAVIGTGPECDRPPCRPTHEPRTMSSSTRCREAATFSGLNASRLTAVHDLAR